MLTSNLVSFLAKCPYLMGNRYISWHRNIVINEFIVTVIIVIIIIRHPIPVSSTTPNSSKRGSRNYSIYFASPKYWLLGPVSCLSEVRKLLTISVFS